MRGDNVLTTAKVLHDSGSMSYKYVAAYLPTDSITDSMPYTVALTCDVDDPDNLKGDDVIFNDAVIEGIRSPPCYMNGRKDQTLAGILDHLPGEEWRLVKLSNP